MGHAAPRLLLLFTPGGAPPSVIAASVRSLPVLNSAAAGLLPKPELVFAEGHSSRYRMPTLRSSGGQQLPGPNAKSRMVRWGPVGWEGSSDTQSHCV